MPRKPRIEVSGVPTHLITRGNNKGIIFLSKDCYIRYLELLKGYKNKFKFKIYCYCLMPNHIHLVLEAIEKAPISKIMQCINTSYTLYINKKFKRTGHVLEGRYKSKIIEENAYLLHLSRYIHMNPIKSGLCQRIEDYKYSSIKYYLPENKNDGLIDTALILSALSNDIKIAKVEYRKFLEDGYGIYNINEKSADE